MANLDAIKVGGGGDVHSCTVSGYTTYLVMCYSINSEFRYTLSSHASMPCYASRGTVKKIGEWLYENDTKSGCGKTYLINVPDKNAITVSANNIKGIDVYGLY